MIDGQGKARRAVVSAVVSAGIRWLYETEQPADALLQHHGVTLPGPANRSYRFAPCGFNGRPVVIVDIARIEWRAEGGDTVVANPLRPGELADVTAELAELGVEVASTWNGHPGTTGSLGLARPAHPSLAAAVSRYLAGCPTHPSEGVFCRCGWYASGYARVVQPTEPAACVRCCEPIDGTRRGRRGRAETRRGVRDVTTNDHDWRCDYVRYPNDPDKECHCAPSDVNLVCGCHISARCPYCTCCRTCVGCHCDEA